MGNFNPDNSCHAGVQWRPSRVSAGELTSDKQALGVRLVASTSDTVESLYVFARSILGGDGALGLEVYDLTTHGGVVPQPALTLTEFVPGIDIHVAQAPNVPGTVGPATGGIYVVSGPYWSQLDSTSLTPGTLPNGTQIDNDEFVANFLGEGYDLAVAFDGVAGVFPTEWITRIRSYALVGQYYDFDTPPGTSIRPYLWTNGRRYFGSPVTLIGAQGPTEVVYDWYLNPDDGMPWTGGSLDGFDAGFAVYGLGWVADKTGSANVITAILQAKLIVESGSPDPRTAVGSTGSNGGANLKTPGWYELILRSTIGGAPQPFALVPGHEYLFSLRRSMPNAGGRSRISLARFEDPAGPIVEPAWTSSDLSLDDVTRRITSLGTLSDQAYAAILTTSGGVSLDSQPYGTASPLDGLDAYPDLNEFFDNSRVYTGRSMHQEFTPGSTAAYGWITVLCGTIAEGSPEPLSIQIRNSGGVAQGSPVLVNATDLARPAHSWHKVGIRVPGTAPTLTSGTQYYFDITSSAAADQGWLVQVLNTLEGTPPAGPPTSSAAATYGGATDRAMVDGVEHDAFDVVVSVATLPTTPSTFTATAQGEACHVDRINLAWGAAPSFTCGEFLMWEIQRTDTVDGRWVTIALISDPTVVACSDWESRRNVAASYRIRVWRSDGVPSDWSATATATAALTEMAGLMFTANSAPDLTVFYTDLDRRTFKFPTNQQQWQPLSGFTATTNELVNRGSGFQTKLRVHDGNRAANASPCFPGCQDPVGFGLDVFEPLRSIARAALPYVCVLNEHGDRWYANVDCTDGTWDQHGIERDGGWAGYTATISVAESTDTPNPFDQAP